jgi:GT2 family glycosyltransferase
MKMLGFSRRYYMSHLPWEEPGQIEVISGAFCMLRRETIERTGLLDEDFFMYGEDIDLSYRILKEGYEHWFVPAAIVHYKGESTRNSSFRYVHVCYQAMLIFFRKHYGHLKLLVSLPIKTAIYFRASLALLEMLTHRLHHFLNPRKNSEL